MDAEGGGGSVLASVIIIKNYIAAFYNALCLFVCLLKMLACVFIPYMDKDNVPDVKEKKTV